MDILTSQVTPKKYVKTTWIFWSAKLHRKKYMKMTWIFWSTKLHQKSKRNWRGKSSKFGLRRIDVISTSHRLWFYVVCPLVQQILEPWSKYVSSKDMVSTYHVIRKNSSPMFEKYFSIFIQELYMSKIFPACISSSLFNQTRYPCHNIPLTLIVVDNDPANSCLGLKISPFIVNGYF